MKTLSKTFWILALSLWTIAALGQAPRVWFTNLTFVQTTNDTYFTIRAQHNPVVGNGTFYTLFVKGTNVFTVNGVASIRLLPEDYTVSFAGIPLSWTIHVTNSSTDLNAADLTTNLVRYSGVETMTGTGGIVITPPTGAGGNWTIDGSGISGGPGGGGNVTGAASSTAGTFPLFIDATGKGITNRNNTGTFGPSSFDAASVGQTAANTASNSLFATEQTAINASSNTVLGNAQTAINTSSNSVLGTAQTAVNSSSNSIVATELTAINTSSNLVFGNTLSQINTTSNSLQTQITSGGVTLLQLNATSNSVYGNSQAAINTSSNSVVGNSQTAINTTSNLLAGIDATKMPIANGTSIGQTLTNSTIRSNTVFALVSPAASPNSDFFSHYDEAAQDSLIMTHGGSEFFFGITNGDSATKNYIDFNLGGENEYVSSGGGGQAHRFYVGPDARSLTPQLEILQSLIRVDTNASFIAQAAINKLIITNGFVLDQWMVNTNPANHTLVLASNTVYGGYLTLTTNGVLSINGVPLISGSALGASQYVATDANTNLVSTQNGFSWTNLDTHFTNYGTVTNIVLPADGNNWRVLATNGPHIFLTPGGNNMGAMSIWVTTNGDTQWPAQLVMLGYSNHLTTNCIIDIQPWGGTNRMLGGESEL